MTVIQLFSSVVHVGVLGECVGVSIHVYLLCFVLPEPTERLVKDKLLLVDTYGGAAQLESRLTAIKKCGPAAILLSMHGDTLEAEGLNVPKDDDKKDDKKKKKKENILEHSNTHFFSCSHQGTHN